MFFVVSVVTYMPSSIATYLSPQEGGFSMKLEPLIKEYLIEIEVRKYTPKTIRGYRNGLSLFLRFCREKLDVRGFPYKRRKSSR